MGEATQAFARAATLAPADVAIAAGYAQACYASGLPAAYLFTCQQIEPKPGRLVLFPSTMWHSTTPFTDGERLVIAFDVGVPRTSR